jgi:hypothetical protein
MGKYRLENNGRNSEDKTINRKNKKRGSSGFAVKDV